MLSTSTIFGFKTYAPAPVWSGSFAGPVKFRPLTKREATRLYHQARRFERQTRTPRRQDGALGRNGLAVLHALIFRFLDFGAGRLDPGYRAIAREACISMRSVARGLQKLKAAGVLGWLRRCIQSFKDGRFTLEQETNAYAINPTSQWQGYTEPPPAPPPEAGTWGDHPGGARDPLAEGVAELRAGASTEAMIQVFETGGGGLAAALARLGRAALGGNP